MPMIYDIHVHTTIQIMVMINFKHNTEGWHRIILCFYALYNDIIAQRNMSGTRQHVETAICIALGVKNNLK